MNSVHVDLVELSASELLCVQCCISVRYGCMFVSAVLLFVYDV